MRRIFWGFCRNWFLMSPLHYRTFRAVPILALNSRRYSYSKNDSPLSPIRGVTDSLYWWCRESPTPRIVETGSRRLPASLIRGVGDSPHHRYGESAIEFLKENSLYRWYGESSTPRTSDTVSRWLPVSLSRRVADSAYHWYGESMTPRIVEWGSQRLRVSVIWGVADSPYPCVGESPTPHITDTESRRLRVSLSRGVNDSAYQWYRESLFEKKVTLASIFSTLNG